MEKVFIRKSGYEYSSLKPAVFEMLESIGIVEYRRRVSRL
jgi:hypothetical protein